MKKAILAVVLVLVVAGVAAADDLNVKLSPKPKAAAPESLSVTDASHQTQSVPERHGSDQAVSYRMFLSVSERGADLVISNTGSEPGVVMLLGRAAGSHAVPEVHATIAPGESWSLAAREPGLSLDQVAYIKSSRRLQLSIVYPGEAPATIYLHPRAAYFEVFSAGNESAVTIEGARQLEFVAPGRREMKKVEAGAPLLGAAHAVSAGAPGGRGVFVTYRAK